MLRRIDEGEDEVIEKVVFRVPLAGEDTPIEVGEIRMRTMNRFKAFRMKGTVAGD